MKNSIKINVVHVRKSFIDLCLYTENIHRFDDYSYAYKELYSNDLYSNTNTFLSR